MTSASGIGAQPPGGAGPSATVAVTMPDIGTPSGEAKIVAWRKRPGERIRADEAICLVAIDDARAEVVAAEAGRVLRLLANVGDMIRAGAPLAELIRESAPWQPRVIEGRG